MGSSHPRCGQFLSVTLTNHDRCCQVLRRFWYARARPKRQTLSHPDPESLPQRTRWRFRPATGVGRCRIDTVMQSWERRRGRRRAPRYYTAREVELGLPFQQTNAVAGIAATPKKASPCEPSCLSCLPFTFPPCPPHPDPEAFNCGGETASAARASMHRPKTDSPAPGSG